MRLIGVKLLEYIGEDDFLFTKDGYSYTFKKGEIIALPDDHWARWLLDKPYFINHALKPKIKQSKEKKQEQGLF